MNKDKGSLALLALIGAALVGGAVTVAIKTSLKYIPPFSFTLLRFGLASLFFIPLLKKEQKITLKSFFEIAIVCILSTANIILFSFGIKLTTASAGQTLYAGVPIIVAVLSYLVLREKINKNKSIGIFLGFIGTMIIIFLPMIGKSNLVTGGLAGNLLIFIGAISYSFYNVYSKKIQKKYSPIQITFVFSLLTVLIVLVPSTIEVTKGNYWWIKLPGQIILAVLYVSILGTSIYYLMSQYAIKYGSPVVASMILYLQPIMTIFWAAILLGEKITSGFVIATIMIFIGAYLTTRK